MIILTEKFHISKEHQRLFYKKLRFFRTLATESRITALLFRRNSLDENLVLNQNCNLRILSSCREKRTTIVANFFLAKSYSQHFFAN